jgi:hypothetical protein
MSVRNKERHRIGRIGWLRAGVLGANDGILSTSLSPNYALALNDSLPAGAATISMHGCGRIWDRGLRGESCR